MIHIIGEMLSKISFIGPWDIRFYFGLISLLPIYYLTVLFFCTSVKLFNRKRK